MKINKKQRRKNRIHYKVSHSSKKPRLIVFRSNKHFYAQVVDTSAKVLAVVDSKVLKKDKAGNKTEVAKALGKIMAEKLTKIKIKEIVFDRGPYRYHGRVKAFADSVKSEGLVF